MPFRRTLDRLRAASAFAPARPAYAAGLRAAIATMAPLVAGPIIGSGAGVWMSIAGFNGTLSDRGGPYRSRALMMTVLALASAAAAALGAVAAGHLALALALTVVVALASGLARVWGLPGAMIGGPTLCTFLISLGIPATGSDHPLGRAAFVVLGGLWAMLIALVLWPLRPYRPVRVAVAACFRQLADYADEICRRAGTDQPHDAWELRAHVAGVRNMLEEARLALAVTRRGRPAETGRGEHLVVLHEVVDQLLVHIIALTESLHTVPRAERDPELERLIGHTLGAMGGTARAIADAILAERAGPAVPFAWNGSALATRIEARMPAGEGAGEAAIHYRHVATLLDRLAQYARVGAATAASLDTGEPLPDEHGLPDVEETEPRVPLAASLRAILAPDSLVLRYALRMAIVTAAAVWLVEALHIRHGYWVTITAVIILQPYTGTTSQKALQRVVGTVLGGILTAALGALFHDPRAIMVLSFVFAAVCVAVLPLNYGVYSMFLTPAFVLLAEASAGDWHLARVRILDTLLGGALALLGARLLWPMPERSRLPAYMADALRANRAYLRAAVALFGVPRSLVADEGPLREVRRTLGLAAANTEESFQRLLTEHTGPAEALTPVMKFLTFTRRVAASVGALALARYAPDAPPAAALESFAERAGETLDDLAAALDEGRRPAPYAALAADLPPEIVASPLVRTRVERLARQIKSLHDAVERWASDGLQPRAEPSLPDRPDDMRQPRAVATS